MTRYLCLMLALAGCVPSTLPRGGAPADSVPAGTVHQVEVTSDEAAAIRERTIYAGAFMRYHAFVSDSDTVEFWHDGILLATIDDQGVIAYRPVVLSITREWTGVAPPSPNQPQSAPRGTAKSPSPNAVVWSPS